MLKPLDLVYVCGNKFLATNVYRSPVQVTYRVVGTDERGSLTLREGISEEPSYSETELETTERGTVELYRDEALVARRKNEGATCGAPSASFAVTGGTPAESGEWSAPFAWPIVAIHASLLPSGKVLAWDRSIPYLWDPATGSFTSVSSPARLFCSGHAFLPSGKLLVAGGHISDYHGIPDITIFSPTAESWTQSAPMRRGRWYPTSTTLSSGDVVILAGSDEAAQTVAVPEVWSPGGLRALTGASLALPYYPRTFLAPNGQVFYAGELQTTRYLDPNGSGFWTTVGDRRYGVRDYGAAVMYDDGKILYAGGGRTTNTAEIIDLNVGAPVWQWTGSMAFPRRHLNATVLPTGEVLVTGGTSGTGFDDHLLAVHAAELWNPATGSWRTLASNSINRAYHSTSILLPDGRVLHAGSGEGSGAPDEYNAELFSPPYLFQGSRPTITELPPLVGYGARFSLSTPNADGIAKVSLIRLGSTTHAFDMNQRFQWLSFTRQTGALSISAPTDPNRAPPGHYLVFILDGNGVPSVGRIVKLDWVALPGDQADPSMVMRVTGKTDATRQYMTVKWIGVSGATVDIYRDGSLLKTVSNTGTYGTSRISTAAGTFVFKVCRSGSTTCSNSATLSFSGTTPTPIPLRVTAWREPLRQIMDLAWSGLSATTVDVYRNAKKVKTTSNTGRYTNGLNYLSAITYRYQVCNAGTTTCSGTASVSFDGSPPPPNVPPVAKFTSSCTDLACSFTDGSTDWDGSVTRWQWTFGDGGTSALRHPTHSYSSSGTYTVALVVTDNTLASGSTAKAVTVTEPPPPNQPPVAAFTVTCTGLSCGFADGSTDSDGTVTAWHWDFGDGTSSAERNPSHAYTADGTYQVTLTATDDRGATSSVTQPVSATATP